MKEMTIGQLLCLTKTEILAIRSHLRAQLAFLAVGSAEYQAFQQTLSNIEAVLLRPEMNGVRFNADWPEP